MYGMQQDDLAQEPVKGLPEALPEGEEILWQGRPDWRVLARTALGIRWVLGYFILLAVWRVLVASTEAPLPVALTAALPFLLLGMASWAILAGIAYIQARETVYTVTSHRVVMRIGAALTLTLNLPYRQIANAALARGPKGTGTITFETQEGKRFSYLSLWPHVRPWHFQTQPAIRAIPEAERVGQIIAEAARLRVLEPEIRRTKPKRPQKTIAAE